MKKHLILAINKDGVCVSVAKDVRFVKKAVLVLKVCREDGLSDNMEENFLLIEISKAILDQMFIICKVN